MPPIIKQNSIPTDKPITGKVLTTPVDMTAPKAGKGRPPTTIKTVAPTNKPLIPPKPPLKPPSLPNLASQESQNSLDTRKIEYPKIVVNGHQIDEEDLKITIGTAVDILGWENEDTYKERIRKEKNIKDPAGYGEDYVLRDPQGKKVRFWHNANNRDFDENHMKKLAQDILLGHYYLNLETIVISKYGNVVSGQHRLAALIWAVLLWRGKDQGDFWKAYWQDQPYVLSLVAAGSSEDFKTLQTYDCGKPRTLTDVYYTSPYFKDLDHRGRKEITRMADYATDLLWKRTEYYASNRALDKVHQTHTSSLEFLERHPRLLECVAVMYAHNCPNRLLSAMRLSPGQCSALLYLMGSSATDPDKGYMENRIESDIDWSNWDIAIEFWKYVASQKADGIIFQALAQLKDIESTEGLGGRVSEKLSVIIKAWLIWVGNGGSAETMTPEDLELEYGKDDNGIAFLVGWPTCGGIDFGGDRPASPKVNKQSQDEEAQELVAIEKLKADRLAKVNSIINETPEQEKARRESIKPKPVKVKPIQRK